jgi:hypothetical protein
MLTYCFPCLAQQTLLVVLVLLLFVFVMPLLRLQVSRALVT